MSRTDTIFYVTGARRNDEIFSSDRYAYCYDAGLFEINFSRKKIVREYIEDEVNEEISVPNYTLSFRGSYISGKNVVTCNHSEILTIDIDSLSVTNRYTNKAFNDMHCVQEFNNETWVVSTGIDMAVKLNGDCNLGVFPVNENATRKYVEGMDYRNISTKPHVSHPNYLFATEEGVWATRFNERDAVLLTDLTKTIDVKIERPHDGVVRDNRVYFTTVNGLVVVSDVKSGKVVKVYDIRCRENTVNVGWCRGLCVDGDYLYVGFTAIRETKNIKNLSYLTDAVHFMRDKFKDMYPARIVKFNIRKERIEDEMKFKASDIGVVFSILKV